MEKQCLPILTCGAGVWCLSKEMIRRVDATFNNAVRQIFGYKKYESIKDIFGFGLLPKDAFIYSAYFVT